MPKLLKGMFKRGRSYYVRLRRNGGDRWVSLGSDYDKACRRVREMRRGNIPGNRITVEEAAEKWLEGYVPTARNAQVRDFYAARGFEPIGDSAFRRAIGAGPAVPSHLKRVVLDDGTVL